MLDRYINLLKSGQIVAFPTETVYGLGADVWNVSAVKKVFDAKGRPADNPLIVHISSRAALDNFAAEIPDDAKKLMTAFWPGPLTLIFKKKLEVPDIVTAGLDTVALRWPSHPLSQDLIARAGPLVAPSANTSGKPSPTRPDHIKEDFGQHFPIVEAGETQLGLESTVLDVSEAPFRLYRPGGISRRQIEEVLGTPIRAAEDSPGEEYAQTDRGEAAESPDKDTAKSHAPSPVTGSGGKSAEKTGGCHAKSTGENFTQKRSDKPDKNAGDNAEEKRAAPPARSPGTKYSHYAPDAQVHWLSDTNPDIDPVNSESTLYLLHSQKPKKEADNIIYFENDYGEMAHQLYDRFRQADRQGYAHIRIEPFTDALIKEQILTEALQNRISKAID